MIRISKIMSISLYAYECYSYLSTNNKNHIKEKANISFKETLLHVQVKKRDEKMDDFQEKFLKIFSEQLTNVAFNLKEENPKWRNADNKLIEKAYRRGCYDALNIMKVFLKK
mgnify:CR=1 FL=1